MQYVSMSKACFFKRMFMTCQRCWHRSSSCLFCLKPQCIYQVNTIPYNYMQSSVCSVEQQHEIIILSLHVSLVRMRFGGQVWLLSLKTRLRFLWIAASHGFRLPEAHLGAGGPGEERAHGCGGGQPAVCVGGLHGEKHQQYWGRSLPHVQILRQILQHLLM